jgi:hypothetical protein
VNPGRPFFIVLLWVYYAAQIMFLGAEFTQVYARHYGSRIVAAPDAEPLRENDKALAEKKSNHPEPERKRIQPEALPWREGERRPASAAGALWSLFVGIAVGFYYGVRGKKQTR